MLDDAEGDEQDLAETFDETHREGEDPNLIDLEDELDPDLDSRAYDATRADGDADEDEDEDFDDLDDEELEDEDLDDDEEDDEDEDVEIARGEALTSDAPEANELTGAGEGSDIVPTANEPELTLAEDLDSVAAPRDRQADKFESNGPLSDEQIAQLGYDDQEARLDEALEETFPASDPPAAHKPD
jgi:hypothetical protein